MRSDAREAAFQAVFSSLLGGELPKGARAALYRKAKLGEEDILFAESLLDTATLHREEISEKLNGAVKRYAEYRIYPADRAALIIALAEIMYFEDIPPVVSVSEAAAIARKYSTEKSADFVNGVLGGIINQ